MTSAPPRPDPVKLLADSHARLEWARTALERARDDPDALRDLAAFLVSLELVARRQQPDTPTASPATSESTTATSRGPTHVRGSATDDNGQASGSLVPNTSRPDPSEPGALRRDLIDTTDQHTWSQYMQEMYCNIHSVAEGPPSSARSTAPPLPLNEPLATDLQKVLAPNSPTEASNELIRKLVASLDTPPSLDSSSSSSPSYPEPLPLDTMRAITASLTATRESEARRRQRQAHRQAVATVLDHYLSTRCSDVNSRDAALLDAVWPIGAGESDDGASTTMGTEQQQEATAPRTSAETTAPTSDEDDDDDEADTRSLATGIREAHESIARKDEKLTWLLGDGFRGGNVAPPPPSNTTAAAAAAGLVPAAVPRNGKTKRTAAPIVMPLPLPLPLPLLTSGSSSIMDSATPSDRTSFRSSQVPHPHLHLHAHRRQGSNNSSFVTPLLRHRRSASTTGTGRISGLATVVVPTDADVDAAEAETRPRLERQRSLSVGEGTHLLTLAAAAAAGAATGAGSRLSRGGDDAARSGLPVLGPVVVVGPPRSPRTDKPFADLAPANAAATGGIDTPTSSSSTSSTQHLLLDSNTLTNSERRELVRRSKKLEGFFGAPFQEATAQRVLVDGRLAPPLPLPPPRSSEPDDSEGGDRQPTEEPREEPPTTNKPEKLMIDTAVAAAAAAAPSTSKAPSSAASSTISPLSSPRRPTFSPPRRESLAAPRMHRSSSSPSRRSASFSSLSSADHTYYSEQSRWRFPLPVEDEQRQREREERRKKLEKVRRFLGERVPVDMVIPCDDEPQVPTTLGREIGSHRSGHVKSASEHWRRGKRLISGKRPMVAESVVAPAVGNTVRVSEEWPYIEPNWQPDEAQLRAAEANHHNDAVDALSKARKLENLFGQLPPSSLYLSPEVGRPRPPPTLQHRHSSSDLASAYSPFAQGATVGGWVPATDSLGRSASSASTSGGGGGGGAADTYRRSIASLSYVAERDPDAMDEVVRVYAAGPRDEPVPEADETADEDDDDDEGPTPEAALMTRSVSAQSVRALRQAQKLSQVLGTTKGAVWGMLLRDLQEAIMDDETLDEEERGDVLRSLDKLRRTAVAT